MQITRKSIQMIKWIVAEFRKVARLSNYRDEKFLARRCYVAARLRAPSSVAVIRPWHVKVAVPPAGIMLRRAYSFHNLLADTPSNYINAHTVNPDTRICMFFPRLNYHFFLFFFFIFSFIFHGWCHLRIFFILKKKLF